MAPPCSNLRFFGSKFIVFKESTLTLLGLFGARGVVPRQNLPLTLLVTNDESVRLPIDTRNKTSAMAIFLSKCELTDSRDHACRKELDGTPRVYDESLMEDAGGQYRVHDVSVDDSDPRLLSRYTERHELPPRPHSARPIVSNGAKFWFGS